MDKAVIDLLKAQLVPEYVIRLLELYGFSCAKDLVSVDEELIGDIEEHVRDGRFSSMVDFSSKSVREKYLGFNVFDVSSYMIKPLDKKKLLKVSAAARDRSKAFETAMMNTVIFSCPKSGVEESDK